MHKADEQAGLPEGRRIYAIGDIHGRADCLQRIFTRIRQHYDAHPVARATLVFLGDYIDKGPDSRLVVEMLTANPLNMETVFLMGNHEYAFREFLAGHFPYAAWLNYGGDATLLSYGITPCSPDAGADKVETLRQALLACLPPTHAEFFARLSLSYTEGGYVFVHAGLRPGIALENQQAEDLLMIRDDFLCNPVQIKQTVIHGHTPTKKPFIRDKSIGIDTGACQTGTLTAIVLEKTTYAFLHS